MDIEEKVRRYKEIREKLEELEAEKRALGCEIMEMMPGESNMIQVGDSQVRRIARLSITTSLKIAQSYGASKMEEVVDKEKIKTLLLNGVLIPGVSELRYIQVTTPKVAEKQVVEKRVAEKKDLEMEDFIYFN